MIYSSCSYPKSCDCSDCEELSMDLIKRTEHPEFKRNYMVRIANLSRAQSDNLAQAQRLYGRDKGLESMLLKFDLEIEYDEMSGDHYVKPKHKKIKNIDPGSSPKMFYTPDEISDKMKGLAHIQIMFNSFNFKNMAISVDAQPQDISLKITVINYTRVNFRNAAYEFVYVQDEQLELFREIYLDIPRKENHSGKVYI